MRSHLYIVGLVLLASASCCWSFTLSRRDEAPYGTVTEPWGGDTWNDSDGFGLGLFVYQGVDTDFSSTIDNITHVKTFSLDVAIQNHNDDTINYVLARGITTPNATLNQTFQIPNAIISADTGSFWLVVNETSLRNTTEGPWSYTSVAASPEILVIGTDPNATFLSGQDGPYGTLQSPVNGTAWTNPDGFGTGRVQYQGIDEAYTKSNYSHSTTFSIDIYVTSLDGSGSAYYLAAGITPDNLTFDFEFKVPDMGTGEQGIYYLVIDETQVRNTSTGPVSYTIPRSAMSMIIVDPPTDSASLLPPSSAHGTGLSAGDIAALVLGVFTAIIIVIAAIGYVKARRSRTSAPLLQRENIDGGNLRPIPFILPQQTEEVQHQPNMPSLSATRFPFLPNTITGSEVGTEPPAYSSAYGPAADETGPSTRHQGRYGIASRIAEDTAGIGSFAK